jgi:hypothetical protein
VNDIDATFGVKLEEINAKLDATSGKLDAISQRLPAEFKMIGAEIATQTRAIARLRWRAARRIERCAIWRGRLALRSRWRGATARRAPTAHRGKKRAAKAARV